MLILRLYLNKMNDWENKPKKISQQVLTSILIIDFRTFFNVHLVNQKNKKGIWLDDKILEDFRKYS